MSQQTNDIRFIYFFSLSAAWQIFKCFFFDRISQEKSRNEILAMKLYAIVRCYLEIGKRARERSTRVNEMVIFLLLLAKYMQLFFFRSSSFLLNSHKTSNFQMANTESVMNVYISRE